MFKLIHQTRSKIASASPSGQQEAVLMWSPQRLQTHPQREAWREGQLPHWTPGSAGCWRKGVSPAAVVVASLRGVAEWEW